METPPYISDKRIVGGSVALDFLNTQGGSPDEPPEDEVLHDYDDVVAWARFVGLLTDRDARRLFRRARLDDAGARATYDRAIGLRADLYELFTAIGTGRQPPPRSMATLRSHEAEALAGAELVASGDGFEWSWDRNEDLARPLWPIVHAATELLTSGPLDRLKRCGGCRWWFIDSSKNRSRRWCAMDDCGTVEKSRRYVARRAAARTRPA
jgi:predicted RNA-binding Zn ribbon-like protein